MTGELDKYMYPDSTKTSKTRKENKTKQKHITRSNFFQKEKNLTKQATLQLTMKVMWVNSEEKDH